MKLWFPIRNMFNFTNLYRTLPSYTLHIRYNSCLFLRESLLRCKLWMNYLIHNSWVTAYHEAYTCGAQQTLQISFQPFLILTLAWSNESEGDLDNYTPATSLSTPLHNKPERFFLFTYTFQQSTLNILGGILELIFAILILAIIPIHHTSNILALSQCL
ncbi:hypothetical protein EI555_000494, partial [Monodon monoceros]